MHLIKFAALLLASTAHAGLFDIKADISGGVDVNAGPIHVDAHGQAGVDAGVQVQGGKVMGQTSGGISGGVAAKAGDSGVAVAGAAQGKVGGSVDLGQGNAGGQAVAQAGVKMDANLGGVASMHVEGQGKAAGVVQLDTQQGNLGANVGVAGKGVANAQVGQQLLHASAGVNAQVQAEIGLEPVAPAPLAIAHASNPPYPSDSSASASLGSLEDAPAPLAPPVPPVVPIVSVASSPQPVSVSESAVTPQGISKKGSIEDATINAMLVSAAPADVKASSSSQASLSAGTDPAPMTPSSEISSPSGPGFGASAAGLSDPATADTPGRSAAAFVPTMKGSQPVAAAMPASQVLANNAVVIGGCRVVAVFSAVFLF
ncbi:hypothetical protein BC830DRAFT_274893 [Chytriomyces sp. MP71]|nr:hypothetical protein BC830DRAFT_274893 [Chytriomyces sp. MP71]